MTKYTDYLGKAIRICRKSNGLTQLQLAEKMVVTPSAISMLENGRRSNSIEMLRQLAEALDIPLHKLFCIADRLWERRHGHHESV